MKLFEKFEGFTPDQCSVIAVTLHNEWVHDTDELSYPLEARFLGFKDNDIFGMYAAVFGEELTNLDSDEEAFLEVTSLYRVHDCADDTYLLDLGPKGCDTSLPWIISKYGPVALAPRPVTYSLRHFDRIVNIDTPTFFTNEWVEWLTYSEVREVVELMQKADDIRYARRFDDWFKGEVI